MTKTYAANKSSCVKTFLVSFIACALVFLVVGTVTLNPPLALLLALATFILLFFVLLRDGFLSLFKKVVTSNSDLTIYGFNQQDRFALADYKFYTTPIYRDRRILMAHDLHTVGITKEVDVSFLNPREYMALLTDMKVKHITR